MREMEISECVGRLCQTPKFGRLRQTAYTGTADPPGKALALAKTADAEPSASLARAPMAGVEPRATRRPAAFSNKE